MKGYKGFKEASDGALVCRDMIYEPEKKYTYDGDVELCERGFHACHELHQVWPFYPNNGENVYYEVECGGEIIESEDGDGKFVCSEIELVKEVELSENCTRFVSCFSFSEGFGCVKRDDGKYNYIKPDGTYLSDEWFRVCESFSEGFGKVQRDKGKWNYIKTDGTYLSDEWVEWCRSFNGGLGLVQRGDDEWFYLDEEGNEYDCVDGKYVPRNKNKGFKNFFKRLFKINQ